jgi:hypothetical protein
VDKVGWWVQCLKSGIQIFHSFWANQGDIVGFQVSVSYSLAPFVEPTWQSGAALLVLKPWEQKCGLARLGYALFSVQMFFGHFITYPYSA